MNRKSLHRPMIGPKPFDKVTPITEFERLSKKQLDAAWGVIGPTVEKNINSAPVWELCTACYLQGLENGSAAMKDEDK